ncbi:uncharacterized protein Z520_11329 [Fonsecaea multimorphosa CBS 102226]|uniref:Uncharacterized protein n=1 Tax=Fonsecaea multimorphosa CBS 102226 TaxID=1442371 RepID=A0A0D2I756_9EURO|nr:uncharacterized protein Z520_11329 [Fonsecaea multimorphosa CBS 102226]KIX93056.1 hypothetical protein Z520_11329 [Fonsecaea multimorphosa CBS 102226]OAL18303.1 hypothetical protein AYO22_10881 [Fonsecaea multimorphosa]
MTEPSITQSQSQPRSQSSRDGSISSTNSAGGGAAATSAGGAAGFLSKITRSPSRRHKPLGSNTSLDATLSAAGSTPPRPRPRPAYTRTATAPPAPVTLNPIRPDLLSRTNSDVTANATADNNMLPLPAGSIAPVYNPSGVNRAPLHKVSSNVSVAEDNTSTHTTKGKENPPREVDVPSALALNGLLLNNSAAAVANQSNNLASYAQIQEMTHKRVATLEYLRRAHEGRSFWFNTVLFHETDITRLPSYTPNRLSRRAVNFMLLGMSLPTILDLHPPQPQTAANAANSTAVAYDYLKNLNTLFTEFESFQQLHPPDGSSASSLSRARIPQMFKRAATTSRPRKSSGAVTDIGLPMLPTTSPPSTVPEGGHHSSQPSIDTTASGITFASSATTLVNSSPLAPMPAVNFPSASAFPPPAPFDAPNSTLLPNEGPYTHLQTPPLPFTPDFFTVFATLCDALIDTYQRLLQILTGPSACTSAISDLFAKVDGRIRKVIVSAIVREFEQASRESAKREMIGVQRVVLGGLMA